MSRVEWFKQAAQYLGGEQDSPPPGLSLLSLSSPAWGLWWGLLTLIVAIFCGQSTKFIYIDF